MSDTGTTIEPTPGIVDATAAPSTGEGVMPPAAPAPPPTPIEYAEFDEGTLSKHVKVKVDGEEIDVPLAEALSGYQRQAAFTKHSQALAEQRREAEDAIRLAQAMRTNPGLTIEVLARHQGMTVQEYLGQQAAAQQQADGEMEFDDPLEQMIHEERQARIALEERLAAREADEQLQHAVGGLKAQYGLNDDQVRAVVQTAWQAGLGIDALPMVYRAMAFDAQRSAQGDMTSQQAAQDAARQAAAAQAAALVGSGAGVNGGGAAPQPTGFKNYREAINAAYDEVERKQQGR